MITVEKIIKNGGATVDRTGQEKSLKSGWQVSVKDLAIKKVADFTQQDIAETIEQAKVDRTYAGFWVDAGKVYIDLSRRFSTKKEAVEVGRTLKQQSILKWANMSLAWL